MNELIRKGDIYASPTVLISGNTSDIFLSKVQRIIRLIYFRIFKPYHEKIIESENNRKYSLRMGESSEYNLIPKIQYDIDLLSKSLNNVFLALLDDLLYIAYEQKNISEELLVSVLKKYKDPIKSVGDDIDDYLLDSRRI